MQVLIAEMDEACRNPPSPEEWERIRPRVPSEHEPIEARARQYARGTFRWLTATESTSPGTPADFRDVISWFHSIIAAKVNRALTRWPDDDLDEELDNDGSAKVALLGIDESHAAWLAQAKEIDDGRSRWPRVGDNVEPMALSEDDLAAIRAAIEEDAAAVRRADWDAITRMFTTDAIRFPPNQPPIRGRAAMRVWLEAFPPLEEFAITAEEIVGGNGLAFVRGTYVMTIAGPTSVTDRGNYMGLMRQQPDGSWLWTTDMAVSELPTPMA